MQIANDQVKTARKVDEVPGLLDKIKQLPDVVDPAFVLVFEWNGDVRFYFNSPDKLIETDLNVPRLISGAQMKPDPGSKQIIKTIYPEGYVSWCGWLGGRPVWI